MIAAVLFDWGDTITHSDWNEEIALAGNRVGLDAVRGEALPANPNGATPDFRVREPLDRIDLVANA